VSYGTSSSEHASNAPVAEYAAVTGNVNWRAGCGPGSPAAAGARGNQANRTGAGIGAPAGSRMRHPLSTQD